MYLRLDPALTEMGDSVVIFGASETPFVMRKIGSARDDKVGKESCILGDCYLRVFMHSELLAKVHGIAATMFGIVSAL